MPPGPLKIKYKRYSADAPNSDMPTNTVKLYQARLLLHCQCNEHACWSSATSCREFLSCCSCNIYTCWPSVLCFSTCNTCWYGVSLSTVPAGVVPSFRPYPLVWCLTISRACWCDASLKGMPSGVAPHYHHACWCDASL